MPYTYTYPRPALTVDCLIFYPYNNQWHILLIQRKNEPFAGQWAFPGGFVDMEETLEQAAARELQEETGLSGISLKQLHTFSEPGRDPRGHTVSVCFYGFTNTNNNQAQAADDARQAEWFPLSALPALAFDHSHIIRYAKAAIPWPKAGQ